MEEFRKRFIIRRVAGSSYLLDISQPGLPYKKPLCINDMGADICSLIIDGRTPEEIVRVLSDEYEISQDELKGDVMSFIASLGRLI